MAPLTWEHTLVIVPNPGPRAVPELLLCHVLASIMAPKTVPSNFLSVCLSLPPDCEKLDPEEVSTSDSYLCPGPCTVLAHSRLCWMPLRSISDLPGPEFLLNVAADPPGRLRAPTASLMATQRRCPSSSPVLWQGCGAQVDLLLAYLDPAVTKRSHLTPTQDLEVTPEVLSHFQPLSSPTHCPDSS